jgi:hypothetical protein
MHVLAEHFRRDQGHAAVSDKKTLAILHRIDADFDTCREHTISVDDALPECDVAMHLYVGQDDRILEGAVAVHMDIGEQQRAPNR